MAFSTNKDAYGGPLHQRVHTLGSPAKWVHDFGVHLRFKGTRAKRAYPFVRPSMSTVTALRIDCTHPARPCVCWTVLACVPPSFCLSVWGEAAVAGGARHGASMGSRLTFPYLGAWTFDETTLSLLKV